MLADKLKADVLRFRQVRDWEQFHSPRNLATAISVEAAELLEPFRWASDEQAKAIAVARHDEIANEIADLVILLTYLTHDLSIDINNAVASKLLLNEEKYPVAGFRGSNRKYSDPVDP